MPPRHLVKGSAAAKAYMAHLRSLRGKSTGGRRIGGKTRRVKGGFSPLALVPMAAKLGIFGIKKLIAFIKKKKAEKAAAAALPPNADKKGGTYDFAAMQGLGYNTAALEGMGYNTAALEGMGYNTAALEGMGVPDEKLMRLLRQIRDRPNRIGGPTRLRKPPGWKTELPQQFTPTDLI